MAESKSFGIKEVAGMGTVHRSLLYIKKKKGRTALALLILFLLSLAVLISVSIQRSVAEEITELKRSMGSTCYRWHD